MKKAYLLIFLVCGFARAESIAFPGWNIAITPYIWLPEVGGTLRYDAGSGIPSDPELGSSDKSLADFIDSAFMLAGEVRKDRWLAVTDFLYVDFANNTSLSSAQMDTALIGKAWTLLGGYRALEGPVEVDVLGGLRYFGLQASTNWQLGTPVTSAGNVSESSHVWDGLVAVRGQIHLWQSGVFLPYYADVGTGGSRLTWQAFGGAGYSFQVLDVSLTYRTIHYDERGDGLMDHMSFTGPAASLSFHF